MLYMAKTTREIALLNPTHEMFNKEKHFKKGWRHYTPYVITLEVILFKMIKEMSKTTRNPTVRVLLILDVDLLSNMKELKEHKQEYYLQGCKRSSKCPADQSRKLARSSSLSWEVGTAPPRSRGKGLPRNKIPLKQPKTESFLGEKWAIFAILAISAVYFVLKEDLLWIFCVSILFCFI